MTAVKQVDTFMETLCKIIILITFCTIIIAAFMQVIWRYVFNDALTWSDELSRYGLVWLGFISAGLGVKKGSHIAIDIVLNLLPAKLRKAAAIVNLVIAALFSISIIYFGLPLSLDNMEQLSPALHVPVGFVYFAVPAGGMIMLVFIVLDLISRLTSKA